MGNQPGTLALKCGSCTSPAVDVEFTVGENRRTLLTDVPHQLSPEKPLAHADAMLDQALSHPPPDAGPLVGATRVQEVTLQDVPDEASLAQWLQARGVDVSSWGQGKTKSVGSCWKEIKESESGLELWQGPDGKLLPVRTTHVLRAKVSSAKGYERGVFLLNTWQQLSNGTKKTRNCLLSEKLMTHEVPVQDNLMDICRRALAEELGFLEDASFELKHGRAAPNQDSANPGNLEVERAEFIDYQMEVMERGSYPGLVTMYHLYTVDIICKGLPERDFNSLEFHGPDKNGVRPMKYIHAWSWLEWSEIQRYLFEGSELKERKGRGCLGSEAELRSWLAKQPGIDLSAWGQDHLCSVQDLYDEVERDEAQLELWGRNDGMPLMIRVVHQLDLLVVSADKELQERHSQGMYLFQTEKSYQDGVVTTMNRHMSKKISLTDIIGSGKDARKLASKKSEFLKYARQAVEQQFQFLEDSHFKLHRHTPPQISEMTRSNISVESASFGGHRFTVEESPSFKGILTMYHKYTMEVTCRGLPTDNFVSLDVADDKITSARSWKWMTWQESQDLLHQETCEVMRLKSSALKCLGEAESRLGETTQSLDRLAATVAGSDAATLELVQDLQRQLQEAQRLVAAQAQQSDGQRRGSRNRCREALPPNLLSEKATESIAIMRSMKTASSDELLLLPPMTAAPAQPAPNKVLLGEGRAPVAEGSGEDCVVKTMAMLVAEGDGEAAPNGRFGRGPFKAQKQDRKRRS